MYCYKIRNNFNKNIMWKSLIINSLVIFLFACAEIEPQPFEPSPTHITAEEQPVADDIPELVQAAPVVPVPEPTVEQEKYTVVVNEVPVKELLFALARDAQVNVDIDPRVSGVVTINAVDQTLPQILNRIARQVNIRYEFEGDNLIIQPDEPHYRTYKIEYVNLSREMEGTNTVTTQISTTSTGFEEGGGGSSGSGGGNNSTTSVQTDSLNQFWATLVKNVSALIGQTIAGTSGGAGQIPITENVIPYPETGLLVVKANTKQHVLVQKHIDLALARANKQVMVQATIVEVELRDQYQAGIDWSFINASAGISVISDTITGVPVGTLSNFVLRYLDEDIAGEGDQLTLIVSLLQEFGDVQVLSSPQLMVLNNQTALLKVVDNEVFFTIESDVSQNQTTTIQTVESTVNTVPVGVVMSVTPQINENDSIILNVRPTISRIRDFATDPAPSIIDPNTEIVNQVPIIQVRELESILRMNHGQIAVLGGLMQDQARLGDNSIPGISRLPLVGRAFETRSKEYFKTELVIFLRPIIVRNPSIESDLNIYKPYLTRSPASGSSLGE